MFGPLSKLCTPAYVYFILSIIFILYILVVNILFGDSSTYCFAGTSCSMASPILMFIFKILYVILWTYILNLLCKTGKFGTSISWFLIILPFFVLIIALYMLAIYLVNKSMNQ